RASRRRVEHELRVFHQVAEQERAVAFLARPAQEARRQDLVCVALRLVDRRGDPFEDDEGFHQSFLTSVIRPVSAAAAAMAGETRWVRLPLPWRPTKLRFEVEAQRLPAATRSRFMPTHIEQPDSRHSKPASRKMRSRPSFSAASFTWVEPGETIVGTLALPA